MSNVEDLLSSFVWVKLNSPDDFLKVRETLERIGVASRKEKKLWQSAHILHKRGEYAIVHFKEMFALDGKKTDFTDEDKGRRNTIANLLEEWGLVKIIDRKKIETPRAPMNQIKVIAFKERGDWELSSKYSIGHTRSARKDHHASSQYED